MDTLPPTFYGLDARPSWNAMGRFYVHGPSGNVAVGDISRYNDKNYPSQRFEVDGNSLLHGSVTFNNRNGESSIITENDNPTALTMQDKDSNPTKYFVVNSRSKRLETHTPLHIRDTRIEAVDNSAGGLHVTAEEGNTLLTFDTRDGAENVKAIKPLNAVDGTDTCGTGTYGKCTELAALTTTGGLTVEKKTFLTGATQSKAPFDLFSSRVWVMRARGSADEGQQI